MAAEILARAGVRVELFDAMPSVGRKFLLAGKGGMNLTHSESLTSFLGRYGARRAQVEKLLNVFGPQDLRDWVHGLGIETFVGSSGRVFPKDMKAAPLLRAWLRRLREMGVQFHMRHRWLGWVNDSTMVQRFETPNGERQVEVDATVLALGGGSWSRLGSDGHWVSTLNSRGVNVASLRPANCGFDIVGSEHFWQRFAGQALKTIGLSWTDRHGLKRDQKGELLITATGVEGSLIYAMSGPLRDEIEASGRATIFLDLLPDRELQRVLEEVSRPRGSRSWGSHLQSQVGIKDVKAGLLREYLSAAEMIDLNRLATTLKALPIRLVATRPIDEAISTAGGVRFEALHQDEWPLMLRALPGVFCAGEMLDWEAPTGGYLLTACFASGVVAGHGVLSWLNK